MIGGILALYATALNTGALVSTRLGSDLQITADEQQETIPGGETRVQMSYVYLGQKNPDSNAIRHAYEVTVRVHHKIGGGESERTWTEGETAGLEGFMRAIGTPAFWKVAGVYGLDLQAETPLAFDEPVREGLVVTFVARAKILTTS